MAGVHDVKASLCRQPVEHADHSERSDEANSTQINRGRTLRSSRSEDLPSTSARETGVRASVGMSRCAKLAGGTGAPPEAGEADTIDLGGRLVLPGLIDARQLVESAAKLVTLPFTLAS